MPSLRDQRFHSEAWIKLAVVAGVGLVFVGVIVASIKAHHHLVTVPRLLDARHDDPVGFPGLVTTQITQLGSEVVDDLIADLGVSSTTAQKRKSLELLSGIDDPRVLPALRGALAHADVGVRMGAVAGMARLGDARATADLFKALERADDWLRQRIIVAIGLTAGEADVATCLARANAASGQERHLFAWAAGQAQRRKLDRDRIGRVPPAAAPQFAEEEPRLQAAVDEALAALDRGPVDAALALAFARLTAVEFGTWNYSHQISYQTVAIQGPLALRGTARMDAVPVPVRRRAGAPRSAPPPAPAAESPGDAAGAAASAPPQAAKVEP